ncbi:MAG: ATP-binding protein [Thermodesulfobacteriota bacterium]
MAYLAAEKTMEPEIEKLKKEIAYYQKIAGRTGNLSLREMEQLSKLISIQREIETALMENEKKLRNIIEHSNELFYLHDTNHVLTYVSPQCFEFFGYTPDEMKIKWTELITDNPINLAGIESTERAIRTGERQQPYTLEGKRKDGKIIRLEIYESPIKDESGRVIAIAGAVRDITERERIESELRQSKKMEAIGTLAGGIAHNFRNILTVISINCQLFQQKYQDDPELMKGIDSMLSYVERGAKLVDDLLEFSYQRPQKEFQPLNLSELLNDIYKIINQTFDKLIDIRLTIPDSIPINGDPADLSQVFFNLCTNARDAMPNGGTLRIEAGIEGNNAYVVIADTGTGMDRETLEKCFEPFFTTKPVDKGTGLGLSTAYGTVKKHGGKITAHSRPGRGATFTLYLPLSTYAVETKTENLDAAKSTANKKILIVDDEIEIGRLIKELLITLGYRVEYVDSGKEAVDKYKSWRPDAVLLDRNMPGMDGMTCAEAIANYDAQAKILILSGYNEDGPDGLPAPRNRSVRGYLTKPVRMNELHNRLLYLLHT